MSQCPDENDLVAYGMGLLPPERRDALTVHLDGCGSCLKTLALLVEQLSGHGASAFAPTALASPSRASSAPDGGVQPLGERFGRFLILELLGRGGMGAVYAAYDPELDRKVALKLPHANLQEGSEGRARLLREAQAMARLSHPNVVRVHDVGELEGQPYVEMEYVQGQTLRRWVMEQPRGWQELLRVFLAAARGLAAAHAVGLVHRDFKPDNVLISQSGEVRVTDFGLARHQLEPEQLAGGELPVAADALTRTGALVGTPAYMAAEQLAGGAADVRSDQFAFCVALYEALYGARPFQGATFRELRAAVAAGQLPPRPRGTQVPRFVHDALARGLRPDPAARFRSMDALVRALSRRRLSRVQLAAGVTAALALCAGAAWRWAPARSPECEAAAARFAQAWGPPQREAIHASFLATGRAFAQESAASAVRLLDSHATAWHLAQADTCAPSSRLRLSAQGLLAPRLECLERRRAELAALVEVLGRADAPAVERAVLAAGSLTPLTGCTEPAALRREAQGGQGAAGKEVREKVRGLLDAARAQELAAHYALARERTGAALEVARQAGDRALEAEALLGLSRIARGEGRFATARVAADEALLAAQAGGRDLLAARAAVVGFSSAALEGLGREEVDRRERLARAAAERAGTFDYELNTQVIYEQATVERERGNSKQALALMIRAVGMREQLWGLESPRANDSHFSLAALLMDVGRCEDALVEVSVVRARRARMQGAEHPDVGRAHQLECVALRKLGRLEEARGHCLEALEIFQSALPPDSLERVSIYNNYGNLLADLGDRERALEVYGQALELSRRLFGAAHVQVADALMNAANQHVALGRLKPAIAMLLEGKGIYEKALAPDHPKVGMALVNLCEAYREGRQFLPAQQACQASYELLARRLGPEHPMLATVLGGLATAELGLARLDAAREHLEQGVALAVKRKAPPNVLAALQMELAALLYRQRRELPRARTLALAAREVFSGAYASSKQVAEIDALLAKLR